MNYFKKALLLFVLPLLAFTVAHKYYLSVSTIAYSTKDNALQITTRVFVDDFDKLLKERYGIEANLGTEKESSLAMEYLEKYFKAKFLVSVNGSIGSFNILGKEIKDDMLVCYLEIPNISLNDIHNIEVQNQVLMDLYEEQQNIVHLKLKGAKKSLILIKESDKGMLKF